MRFFMTLLLLPVVALAQEEVDFFTKKGLRKTQGEPALHGRWHQAPLPPATVEYEGARAALQMQSIQATLLPNGKVLMVSGSSARENTKPHLYRYVDNTALFDPAKITPEHPNGFDLKVSDEGEHGFEKVPSAPTPEDLAQTLPKAEDNPEIEPREEEEEVMEMEEGEGEQVEEVPAPPQQDLPEEKSPRDDPNTARPNIDLFCSGQAHLPDGNVLFVGGTATYPTDYREFFGARLAWIFRYKENKWDALPPPQEGRWYPTLVELGDGKISVWGGLNSEDQSTPMVDIYDPESGEFIEGPNEDGDFAPANMYDSELNPFDTLGGLDIYPRIFLMNDGRLFITGDGTGFGNRAASQKSTLFAKLDLPPDEQPKVTFTLGPQRSSRTRFYPTAFFDPTSKNGDFLIVGGGIGEFQLELFRKETKFNTDPEMKSVASALKYIAGDDGSTGAFAETIEDFLGRDRSGRSGRINHTAVILPTREVLIVGGGNHGYQDPIFHPILFSPKTDPNDRRRARGGFVRRLMNPHRVPRLYHTAALLLPDGRVWLGGGNSGFSRIVGFKDGVPVIERETAYTTGVERTFLREGNKVATEIDVSEFQPAEEHRIELFEPTYLFKPGPRPVLKAVITAAQKVAFPSDALRVASGDEKEIVVRYGAEFTVEVSEMTRKGAIRLVKLGAMTHGFDVGQKLHDLEFSVEQFDPLKREGTLKVKAPSNSNAAPPGFYMLFYLNEAEKPAKAQMIVLSHKG